MGETVELIRRQGLVAVVKAPVEERLLDWSRAVAKGGIKLLGIPVTFPRVTEITAELADETDLTVGVSGVISIDQIMIAMAAGADFIISPISDSMLIRAAKDRGLEVIAGAATPTEVNHCVELGPDGPDMIAVYPAASMGGPEYFKHLVPNFPVTPIAASGGVDVESAPAYLEAGAVAAIVDTGVFPADEDPAAIEVITMRALALTEVVGDVMGNADRMSMTDILTSS
ncbi:MAG: bifunctional 4-hydroxy-2-oxoglutarate aldolase/2-dehydro-3-deoxy-phosphogluconate aldolase [Myxococcota bacterium]